MAINFAELVNKVETLNKQNREQAIAQIKPYFEVMYKKAAYEHERKKERTEAATAIGEMATHLGFQDYKSNEGYSPEMQLKLFDSYHIGKQPIQYLEGLRDAHGIELKEGYKTMNPEAAKIYTEEVRSDIAISKTINDLFAAYPEIETAMMQDDKFAGKTPSQQKAIIDAYMAKQDGARGMQEWMAKKQYEHELAISKQNMAHRQRMLEIEHREAVKGVDSQAKSELTVKQQEAQGVISQYEKGGKVINRYKVRIYQYDGRPYAEMAYDGKRYRTDGKKYQVADENKRVWKEIDMSAIDKPAGKLKSKGKKLQNIRNTIGSGLREYQDAQVKLRSAEESIKQIQPGSTAGTTGKRLPGENPENDWLFE